MSISSVSQLLMVLQEGRIITTATERVSKADVILTGNKPLLSSRSPDSPGFAFHI